MWAPSGVEWRDASRTPHSCGSRSLASCTWSWASAFATLKNPFSPLRMAYEGITGSPRSNMAGAGSGSSHGDAIAFVAVAVRPDGKLVVAWVDGRPVVRWFEHCDRYALLRAENPAAKPAQFLIDLAGKPEGRRFRRVLWITTPH